ncbi:MAG: type II 3-dehydroquinate dehydratase [Prolixibacteraceae bacterium]|jgi:3-dehydroquinate dehydratase-2|nr:type II 3-dehydroquinate dehydratase [Prolixibacteraceae bacterium]
MNITIVNGPNLNLLGKREKGIYGDSSFEDWLEKIRPYYTKIKLDYFQSNVEGEIVSFLQKIGFSSDGIILNAGAYTHTSVAIRDAIAAVTTPVVEVHISNILTREAFRHESVIGPVCRGSIMGFGLDSYRLGIESFLTPDFK